MYEYPFAWPSPVDQPAEWAKLHEEPLVPVKLPSGDTALLITRYDDVRAVLADHRVTKNRNRKGAARMTEKRQKVFQTQVSMDPANHMRMRRLIGKALTVKRVELLRPRIAEIVDELLDDLAGAEQPVDLNAAFSFPLTILVICELLGVPEDERANFGDTSSPPWDYMRDLIERRRAGLGDDLISALIQVHDTEDGRLSTDELVWWCTLLLLAGYETTANQVSGSVVLLLSKPAELERVRADPALVPAAVEELLRCQVVGSSLSMLRVVTDDIEVAGCPVPAGTSVIPALDSANHDPAAFGCPAQFDLDRPERRQQLTFSSGRHFCPGAPLARIELQEALGRLIRRFPGLRLAVPMDELTRAEDIFFPAFTTVPVRFSSDLTPKEEIDMEPTPYPFERPDALAVPVELAGLRAEPVCPVRLPSGDDALMVTRYADVRKLLTDDRLSRNLGRPGAARISKQNRMFQDPRIDPDPPEHTRVRRLVMKAFSAARVERLRPYITDLVDELLDKMEADGGPIDLNEALAFPLPIQVICKLLGVPDADHDRLRGWTEAFLSISQFNGEQIGRSMKEMTAYIAELVEHKRQAPGDDLISAMIRVRDEDDGALTDYELHWWCRLLLLVGYETTATQLGGGVALLLAHPEQLAALRADYGLIPQAVEETLRWKLVGSSVSMLRYAVADIEMDGFTIAEGTSVIPAVDSANQDGEIFEHPERFDILRTVNPHLTFSLGAHFCIGAALARLQLQIATERLLRRFPSLRLHVPVSALRRQPGALLEGFTSIPVEW